ncbi:MAG: DUF4926 domain-containing protein [Planctomycetaceae bacterium]
MISEHSIVVLNQDHIADGLYAGDVGAIVHIYSNGKAYEVEFVDGDGTTVALLTLEADDVRSIKAGELLHTRRRGESFGVGSRLMKTPIASLKLVEVATGGTRIPISVEIGCPYFNDRGVWTCCVHVDGLDSKPRDTYGEDSLQALLLALRLVHAHLEGVMVRGGRLVHADDGSEFPLDAYFTEKS